MENEASFLMVTPRSRIDGFSPIGKPLLAYYIVPSSVPRTLYRRTSNLSELNSMLFLCAQS